MPLIHFTRSREAVANILSHGFAYVALPTKVAAFVLPDIPVADRQPQQFGMICFRQEHDGERSKSHRIQYGPFGIVVHERWAREAGAHPVLYLHAEGAVSSAIKRLMTVAVRRVREEEIRFSGDSARTMAYHNRAMASAFGAYEWADLLELFQYLALGEDEWEREWRIVQQRPVYSIPKTGSEAVAQVSPPQGWARHLNVCRAPREAVHSIVVPAGEAAALRRILPEQYRDIPITEETA